MRQPDLLASTEFTEAFFLARRLRFEGDNLSELRGEGTCCGINQPLSLRARRFACRVDGVTEVRGVDLQHEIQCRNFGVTLLCCP